MLGIGDAEALPVGQVVLQEVVDIGNLHLQADSHFKVDNLGLDVQRCKDGFALGVGTGAEEKVKHTGAHQSHVNHAIGCNAFNISIDSFFTFPLNLDLFLVFLSREEAPHTTGGLSRSFENALVGSFLPFFPVGTGLGLLPDGFVGEFVVTFGEHTHEEAVNGDNGSGAQVNHHTFHVVKLGEFRLGDTTGQLSRGNIPHRLAANDLDVVDVWLRRLGLSGLSRLSRLALNGLGRLFVF